MVLGGPIDWDLGELVPDLVRLGLLGLAGLAALLVTTLVLLAVVTAIMTRLRGPDAGVEDED